jgi:tripeptide aminopeptidase
MTTEPNTLQASGQMCAPLFDIIERKKQEFIDILIRICEVPAPPYNEERRALFLSELFASAAIHSHLDAVGNVRIPLAVNGRPHLVISAHLDTVFPFDTIQVQRSGSILLAPGISDDSAGLAALYVLGRAFVESGFLFQGSLTLLATVGEEGLGNLRGVRHFFSERASEVDYFISLDGCDPERFVTRGLASKRVRLVVRGPGGHSWGDADTPNPIHAVGSLLAAIELLKLSANPKTTLNVGIIEGGTSVNAIPKEVALDMDLRSESSKNLSELSQWLDEKRRALAIEKPQLSAELILLGERPSGAIAEDHELVRLAVAANREFGLQAKLESGSTDSNIPFSLGIPALTIGVGGRSGKIHTPEEWYDVRDAERGLKRTALLIAGLLNQHR